jgi:hypothetical protein
VDYRSKYSPSFQSYDFFPPHTVLEFFLFFGLIDLPALPLRDAASKRHIVFLTYPHEQLDNHQYGYVNALPNFLGVGAIKLVMNGRSDATQSRKLPALFAKDASV